MRLPQKKILNGFTLIELLLVVSIIAILALLIFVALNPVKRFQDARDARRAADVNAIAGAIKLHQIDNGGYYLTAVSNASVNEVYMIGGCTSGATAIGVTDNCTTNPTLDACLNLVDLVTVGYLGNIPISPNGTGSWGSTLTGYTLQKSSTTTEEITIRACENEDTTEIKLTR